MIALTGGEEVFENRLDSLFVMHLPEEFYSRNEDITESCLVGGYVCRYDKLIPVNGGCSSLLIWIKHAVRVRYHPLSDKRAGIICKHHVCGDIPG